MRKAARFETTLALALLAHGGALLASGRLAHRPDPVAPSPSGDPIEIGIETTPIAAQDTTEPPVQPPMQSLGREDAPSHEGALARMTRSTHAAASSGPDGVAELSLPRAPAAPEASGRPWTFSPSAAGSVWLGLRSSPDGRSTFEEDAVRRPAQDGVSTAADSVRAALEAHDRSLGLGAAGPLVEPTREAVSASLVPDFARAILEFTTDRAGIVVSVRVLDATSDRQAWDEVAQKLALDTRKKPLRMPAGARGVAVTMQVESTMRNASGQDPGQGILSRAAGGLFEPSELLMDSQAKPRRVVVARVLSETRL